jgi:hypothetical protein
MNNNSAKSTNFNKQPSDSTTLAFYAISYTFWILLFVMNHGPGGVESQHLVIVGITHTILIFIHATSAFDPKGYASNH